MNSLRERGYNEDWMQSAVRRFENKNEETSLNKKRLKFFYKIKLTVCFVQYSLICSDIKKNIRDKHWYILKSDPLLSDIFEKTPSFVYKRPADIRADVNSSVERPTQFLPIPSGNYSCGRSAQCNFPAETNVFSHPHSGREFKIKGVITCTAKNVIDLIKCPCGLAHIGKTQSRIAEHRSSIRTNEQQNPVAVHFNLKRHNLSTLGYI